MSQVFTFEVGPEGGVLSEIKCPSVYEWGLNDVSASESGRTDNAIMHKNRVAQKRKIKLAWNGLTPSEIATILTAFNPEYVDVKSWDFMDGADTKRTYYVGDREGNVKVWTSGNKVIETISFDIIER